VIKKHAHSLCSALLPILLLINCGPFQTAGRPENWAKPVASQVLKNWYQLDEDVYRSLQPDRKGFEEVWNMGIKTIINLRSNHSDASLIEGLGLNLVEIPMKASSFTEDTVIAALRAIRSSPKPVLVHCQHGADRTGVILAMYRIVFQGWAKEEALAELTEGGFGYHSQYKNIPTFVRAADLEKIRAALK
jgi:protein tyrosine/serine phosphatase